MSREVSTIEFIFKPDDGGRTVFVQVPMGDENSFRLWRELAEDKLDETKYWTFVDAVLLPLKWAEEK